jgi:hypothetical protein
MFHVSATAALALFCCSCKCSYRKSGILFRKSYRSLKLCGKQTSQLSFPSLICALSNECTRWRLTCESYVTGIGTLNAGLLTRSQYSEGPATGHLNTGFSWFPCVYKRMLRWFSRFQVATTCFSCSPPDLNVNLLVIIFIYLYTCKITTATGWQPNCS